MRKKIVSLVIGLTMVASLMSGCGNQESGKAVSAVSGVGKEIVEESVSPSKEPREDFEAKDGARDIPGDVNITEVEDVVDDTEIWVPEVEEETSDSWITITDDAKAQDNSDEYGVYSMS